MNIFTEMKRIRKEMEALKPRAPNPWYSSYLERTWIFTILALLASIGVSFVIGCIIYWLVSI